MTARPQSPATLCKASNLCSLNSLNLGTCQNDPVNNNYKCICDGVYFSGTNCQAPIDRCAGTANPCKNGATCLNGKLK